MRGDEKVGEQYSQTDSSLNMFHILNRAPELTPEASTKHGRSTSWKRDVQLEPDSGVCNALDQNSESLLRRRPEVLPGFKPLVNKAPGNMKQEFGEHVEKTFNLWHNSEEVHVKVHCPDFLITPHNNHKTHARLASDFFRSDSEQWVVPGRLRKENQKVVRTCEYLEDPLSTR